MRWTKLAVTATGMNFGTKTKDSVKMHPLVRLHKPDAAIFRLALDIAVTPAQQIVYIENTPMFVQIAEGLGIRGIVHTDYKSTCEKLSALRLQASE